jgi:hypothetical protein
MQIADWIEKLGMSEYTDRFAENRIDFSVLPDLTDRDLEKLGVLLGDRRKMLRAIAKLEAVDAPIAVATTAPATPRSVDTAERGHVRGKQRYHWTRRASCRRLRRFSLWREAATLTRRAGHFLLRTSRLDLPLCRVFPILERCAVYRSIPDKLSLVSPDAPVDT